MQLMQSRAFEASFMSLVGERLGELRVRLGTLEPGLQARNLAS